MRLKQPGEPGFKIFLANSLSIVYNGLTGEKIG